jgi:hypothetical protein
LVAILPDFAPIVRHSPKCNRRELGAFSWGPACGIRDRAIVEVSLWSV